MDTVPVPVRTMRELAARSAFAQEGLTLAFLASALLAVTLIPVLLYFEFRLTVAVPLSVLIALTSQPFFRFIFDSSGDDVFSPAVLVAGYFVVYFGMRSFYLCAVPFLARLGRNPYDDYLPAALWCTCAGYVSFVAGFGSKMAKRWRRRLPVVTHSLTRVLPASRLLLLIVVGFGSLAYLFEIGVAVGNFGSLEFQRHPPPGVLVLLENLLDLSWVAICVYLVVAMKTSQRLTAWLLLRISFGILCLKLAISGGKVALIQPLMEAAIVIHYGRRRFRFWETLIIGLPALMLAFGTVNFYRFVVVGRRGSPKSMSDLVSRVSSAAAMMNSKEGSRAQPSALEQMVDRNAGTDALALIMKYTPHPFPYAAGRPWLQVPLTFVPRQIWKNKPINIPSAEFESTYMGLPSTYNGFTSMQLIGDLYRNFSWAGVVGGMFILGAALRVFYLFCSPSGENTAGLFLYAALFPEIIHSLESDAGYACINVTRAAGLAIGVAVFLGARFRRIPRGVPAERRLIASIHPTRLANSLAGVSRYRQRIIFPALLILIAWPFACAGAEEQGGAARPSRGLVDLSSLGARPNDPKVNSRLVLQQGLEKLKMLGGGTLSIPAGDYYFYFPDIASDVDPHDPRSKTLLQEKRLEKGKLILVPPEVILQGSVDRAGKPATRIHWAATSFPLFSFVSADGAGAVNLSFIFDGVQPQFFPWAQEDFLEAAGYKSRWLGGPYEISAVIYAIGSSNLRFENLSFLSSKMPADNEHTFAFGIVAKGKSPVPRPDINLVRSLAQGARIPGGGLSECVANNTFRSLQFQDYVMGILASGQCGAVFDNIQGNYRGSWYRSFDPSQEGSNEIKNIGPPGHLIYLTFQNAYDVQRTQAAPNGSQEFHSTTRNQDVTVRNVKEGGETLSNVDSLGTLALKNMQGGMVADVISQHPAGLIQSMIDAHDVQLENLSWSSDRDICDEARAAACGVPVITLEPTPANSGTEFSSGVQFKNVKLHGLRRSVMFKISEESGKIPLSRNVSVDGLTVECNPTFVPKTGGAQGVITVRSLATHFANVRLDGVIPSGAAADRQNYAAVIQSRSQDTSLEITIPAAWAKGNSAAASKCLVEDQTKNKCQIVQRSTN